MRTLAVIAPLLLLIGACADIGPDDAPVATRGALALGAPEIALETTPSLVVHALLPLPEAGFVRPNAGLRESHRGGLFRPGVCAVSVSFAGAVGAADEIDAFRLPACLDEAPSLASLLPLVYAEYGDELAWEGEPTDRATLVEDGLATEAQLDSMDAAAASDEQVEYYVASVGDHTLIVAYYPDQGRLFGIIVTVGDAL